MSPRFNCVAGIVVNDRIGAVGRGQLLGDEVRLRPLQAFGLRLAAPFGDGFGEGREQHREPQPGGDLAGETGLAVMARRDRAATAQ